MTSRTAARAARAALASFTASLIFALLAPSLALASDPTFGTPSVVAMLGQPLEFTSTINGGDIASVDVVIHLQGNPTSIVVKVGTQIDDVFQTQANIDIASSASCSCLAQGNSAPNTHFDYQFRVTDSKGATSVGPQAQGVVADTRFSWQELDDRLIHFHWYAGDQAFATAAAASANDAIAKDTQALGVTIDQPFDMFVYDTEEAMRTAVSPNRENVQAEAHPNIDTIFAWLPSNQPADQYNRVVIAHELTHLVFHHVVDNPYRGVPRWLDEGTAVYMSEGYTAQWQGYVNSALASKSLIPLDGLAGLFPSVQAEFYLAYGESVAAVDYFIRTYGEPKFWDLVRSYAAGVSDDQAFTSAIGTDAAGFGKAWFESMGAEPPGPIGPQPGVPGPVPTDWSAAANGAPATLSPSVAPAASPHPSSAGRETAGPLGTPRATLGPDGASSSRGDITQLALVLGLVVALVVGTLVVGIMLRNRSGGPPSVGF